MMKVAILPALVLTLAFTACGQKQTAESLYGDWTGESKCTGNNPSCHDETVVYHLTRSKSDPAKINLAADKIVDGKPDPMGEFEMTFDPEKMTLTGEFTIKRTGGKGVWLFIIKGDKMDGTLTVLPENEIGRRVSVTRKKNDKE